MRIGTTPEWRGAAEAGDGDPDGTSSDAVGISRTVRLCGETLVARFPPVLRRLRDVRLGFSYARELFREPITPSTAIAGVQARLVARDSAFVETVERAIFAYGESPYRPLLEAAGYDLSRIKSLVASEGVEATLRRLCQDGVYVSIEEFKGVREARRGDRIFRFNEQAFQDRKSTRLNSSHSRASRMPSSA